MLGKCRYGIVEPLEDALSNYPETVLSIDRDEAEKALAWIRRCKGEMTIDDMRECWDVGGGDCETCAQESQCVEMRQEIF
jgi:hypothetical protein